MVGTKNNRRAQATKQQLQAALLQLLQTKPLAHITVTEICQVADVNRGTFYSHYRDPADLFAVIETDLVAKVTALIDQQDASPAAWLTQILTLLKQNETATAIIISELTESPVLQALLLPIKAASLKDYATRFNEHDPAVLAYYFEFFLSGAVRVITRWLQTGAQQTPAQIAQVITRSAGMLQANH